MIVPLKKVNMIAPRKYQEEILETLHSMGIAHIIDPENNEDNPDIQEEIEKTKFTLANIKFSAAFLNSHIPQKQSFKDKLNFTPKSVSYRQIKKRVIKLNISKITDSISEIEKNLEQGQSKLIEMNHKITELQPWTNLMDMPEETKHTNTITGLISLNKYPEFIRKLEGEVRELEINTVYTGIKDVYLQISYLKSLDDKINELIFEFDFRLQKPEINSSPAEDTTLLKQNITKLRDKIKKWNRYIKNFKKYIEPFKMAEDYYSWYLEKLQIENHIEKTKYFIQLKAWVKKADSKLLKNTLAEISPEIVFSQIKIKADENVPVVIENSKFIRPFETVTGIYGLPRYNEIDPTPFLAPFFIIFFALCLTDAGYGLVMAIGSFAAIKFLKIPVEKQRLFRLLGYGGIVTFIIGALFGGWFGIDVSSLAPGPIKSFIEFFRVINPMQDTLLFMIIAFALGIIQLWFARIVRAIAAVKIGSIPDLASAIAWAVFLMIGVLLLVSSQLSMPFLTNILLYILLADILALIITESWSTKNYFVKPFIGIINIFQGLIGIMSDTLSYSRLMALGLATGIIAFIINTIAVIFRDLIPYAGWIVWFLILVGGHIFNLGINALGSFIHAGRLQFVEFFPKFMEGGGRRFIPFKRHSKYFSLRN